MSFNLIHMISVRFSAHAGISGQYLTVWDPAWLQESKPTKTTLVATGETWLAQHNTKNFNWLAREAKNLYSKMLQFFQLYLGDLR